MTAADLAIVVAFLAYAIGSGLRARRTASQNLDEYFLAGRTLPGWKAGLSMAATQFAADTPLLVTGLIATAGVFSLWRLWIYAVSFLLLGIVLAPSWRRAGVLTDAELAEVRYGTSGPAAWLRGVKAIYFGTVFNCVVLSFVLLAATRIAEPFLTWDQWSWFPSSLHAAFESLARAIGTPLTIVGDDPASWPPDVWVRSANNLISIGAILVVTALYSTTGGLRSVVDTDVVQLVLMVAGTAVFAWIMIDRAGGLSEIPSQIRSRYPDDQLGISGDQILGFTPTVAKDASTAVLGVIAIQWLAQMNSDGTGYLAQRVMACRSDRDARVATIWFTVTQILVRSLLWIPLALALLVVFPPDHGLPMEHLRSDREFTYVRAMAELPPGIKGLLVTAMLAALASTVDTHLNWGSSYWTNDLYRRFVCQSWRKREPSPRSLVWVARGANLLLLGLSLALMTRLGSIGSAWRTSLLLGAGMGGMLILRWLWWRVTAWGELGAIAVSAVLAPVLLHLLDSPEHEAIRLLLMFTGSTLAGIIISVLTAPPDPAAIAAFYERAKPPGWWGPVAHAAGAAPRDDVMRLLRGLAAVVAAALALFSCLTLVGSLVTQSAPPTWLPWRPVWFTVLGVVIVVAIAIWRRVHR